LIIAMQSFLFEHNSNSDMAAAACRRVTDAAAHTAVF